MTDLVVGDVWFCSGQSNMGWSLGQIENGTEEVAASLTYTNIRFSAVQCSDRETKLQVLPGEHHGGAGAAVGPDAGENRLDKVY